MSEEIFINSATQAVEWRAGSMYLGLHLRLAKKTRELIVIHSRGWGTGTRSNRVYVPAQYHVFRVLSRGADDLYTLDHLVSFNVRLDPARPSDAMLIAWRPYPDPDQAPTDGARSGERGS